MDTIRIGMIGTGMIADLFASRVAQLDGVTLAAVCGAHPDKTTAFAQAHAIPTAYPDHRALAADGAIEAVYVASPNSLHAEHAIAMLQAGKHVLVEKPMAMDTTQVQAMIAAADQADRLLVEAYIAPFEPNIAAIRDALPRIDQLRRVVLVKDQYSSRFDAYKAGQHPVAFDPAFGGGSTLDLGFYGVSLAVHLFGEPASITASGILLDSGADGQGTIVLGYDGFEVDCLHSKIATRGIDSQIAGEKSVIVFDEVTTPSRVALLELGAYRQIRLVEDLTRERVGGHMDYEIDGMVQLLRADARQCELHPLSNTLAAARILDEVRRQVGVHFPTDN